MKKNSTQGSAQAGLKKKRGLRWSEIMVTALAIFLIGGWFVWLTFSSVSRELKESESRDEYQASLPIPGASIDPKLVCMVNDMYMGVEQIPVLVSNKTYYGCCEKCVKDLNSDEKTRIGPDPLTGETVDKALAFITLNPNKKGAVLYFKSKQNAEKYFE